MYFLTSSLSPLITDSRYENSVTTLKLYFQSHVQNISIPYPEYHCFAILELLPLYLSSKNYKLKADHLNSYLSLELNTFFKYIICNQNKDIRTIRRKQICCILCQKKRTLFFHQSLEDE